MTHHQDERFRLPLSTRSITSSRALKLGPCRHSSEAYFVQLPEQVRQAGAPLADVRPRENQVSEEDDYVCRQCLMPNHIPVCSQLHLLLPKPFSSQPSLSFVDHQKFPKMKTFTIGAVALALSLRAFAQDITSLPQCAVCRPQNRSLFKLFLVSELQTNDVNADFCSPGSSNHLFWKPSAPPVAVSLISPASATMRTSSMGWCN